MSHLNYSGLMEKHEAFMNLQRMPESNLGFKDAMQWPWACPCSGGSGSTPCDTQSRRLATDPPSTPSCRTFGTWAGSPLAPSWRWVCSFNRTFNPVFAFTYYRLHSTRSSLPFNSFKLSQIWSAWRIKAPRGAHSKGGKLSKRRFACCQFTSSDMTIEHQTWLVTLIWRLS